MNPHRPHITHVLAAAALFAVSAPHVQSQTGENYASSLDIPILETVTVVGSVEQARTLPGSAAYIGAEEIRSQSYENVNRVLARVPGVYVREEDGHGNFPNISLRGVDTGRSAKVTLLEDSVPISPAPYSAPEVYNGVNVARMSGVEVLKGSSQIRYGPHTTGGVINFLSTPIPGLPGFAPTAEPDGKSFKSPAAPAPQVRLPSRLSGFLKGTYGSFNDVTGHGYAGATYDTEAGEIGFLLEGFYRQTDGFRHIEGGAGFGGSDDTGFQRFEPMLKLSWAPPTATPQLFELKIGYSIFDADESYLGLSEKDIRANPHRRYAATRFDDFTSEHLRAYLRHTIAPTDWLQVTTTGYYNKFDRNWFKLHDIRVDGSSVGLSEALAVGGKPLEVLRGRADGRLRVRNNNRHYYQGGIEQIWNFDFATGPVVHDLDLGIRYHVDQTRRNQRDEFFVQNDEGRIVSSSLGIKGAAGNRREEAQAWAFFARDSAKIGKLTLTPGVRYERIDYQYTDFGVGKAENKATVEGSSAIDVFAPGIGANYAFTEQFSIFGGVHKGFSVPGPRANAREGIQEETSIGYELGARYAKPEAGFATEIVLFHTDFNDLIVIDNIGGAGNAGFTENAGDITSTGVEYIVAYDPGVAHGWGFSMPNRLAFTYTNAELSSDSQSTDAESIFSGGREGNRVPYIPEYVVNFSTGLDFGKVALIADFTYVPETFATANNVDRPIDAFGEPDSRFGTTDEYFLVDLTAEYRPTDTLRFSIGVKNLLDDEYIVSRLPHGPRSGAPRTFYGAVALSF